MAMSVRIGDEEWGIRFHYPDQYLTECVISVANLATEEPWRNEAVAAIGQAHRNPKDSPDRRRGRRVALTDALKDTFGDAPPIPRNVRRLIWACYIANAREFSGLTQAGIEAQATLNRHGNAEYERKTREELASRE
jgi:hypothetical protein